MKINKDFFMINTKELFYDIVLTIYVYFTYKYFATGGLLINSMSEPLLLTVIFLIFIALPYYMGNIYNSYTEKNSNKTARGWIFATYILILLIMLVAVPMNLYEHGYFDDTGPVVVIWLMASLCMLTGLLLSQSFADGLTTGFIVLIFLPSIIAAVPLLQEVGHEIRHDVPKGLRVILGFIAWLTIFILMGLVASKILKSKEKLKLFGEKISGNRTYKILFINVIFTIIITTLLCVWNEIYYELILADTKSPSMNILFLFITGVVPLRIIVMLEPPVKFLNLISGTAIIVFYLFTFYN